MDSFLFFKFYWKKLYVLEMVKLICGLEYKKVEVNVLISFFLESLGILQRNKKLCNFFLVLVINIFILDFGFYGTCGLVLQNFNCMRFFGNSKVNRSF